MSTKKVSSKTSPAKALASKSASIKDPEPAVGEKSNGKDNCPLIPVISWVPTLATTIVKGTFWSPGFTSIYLSGVPKNASRNFTSPNFLSNGDSEPACA
jgi:hypothetical protein